MERLCDSCRRAYVAKRANSRFCSDTCRKRGQRAGVKRDVVDPVGVGPVVAAARAELEAAGALDSLAGQRVLYLARLLESPAAEAGSSKAAVDRQLAAAMVEALGGAAMVADPLDEVARKRDEKRAAAGRSR